MRLFTAHNQYSKLHPVDLNKFSCSSHSFAAGMLDLYRRKAPSLYVVNMKAAFSAIKVKFVSLPGEKAEQLFYLFVLPVVFDTRRGDAGHENKDDIGLAAIKQASARTRRYRRSLSQRKEDNLSGRKQERRRSETQCFKQLAIIFFLIQLTCKFFFRLSSFLSFSYFLPACLYPPAACTRAR